MHPILFLSIGIGIIAMTAILLILATWPRKTRLRERPDWFTNLINKKRLLPYAASILVLVVGTWLFRNPIPAVLAIITALAIIWQVEYRRRRSHRLKVLDQLASAVSIYAGAYDRTKQIIPALKAVAQACPGVVGQAFDRAYKQMSFREDADKVFAKLAQELDVPHGYVFADLVLKTRSQGGVTASLFYDLAESISKEQGLIADSNKETAVGHIGNTILCLLVFICIFVMPIYVPGMGAWLLQTIPGRLVVSMAFISVIAWFAVERLVNEY